MTATQTEAQSGTSIESRVTACAQAALPLLPAPQQLSVGPISADLSAVAMTGQAIVAAFSGGISGELAVLVTEELVEALRNSPLGELDVVHAVQPALEAASAELGSVVLEPGRLLDIPLALESLGERASVALAPLLDGGTVGAAVVLAMDAAQIPAQRSAASFSHSGLELLRDVEMEVTAELGRTRMTVRELLSLSPGMVVELDRAAGSPADLLVNGRLIARGEVVVVDEDFGIRITEILSGSTEGMV